MRRFLIQPSSISSAAINLLLCINLKFFCIAFFFIPLVKQRNFLSTVCLAVDLKEKIIDIVWHSLYYILFVRAYSFALDVYVIAYYEPLIALIYAYSTSPIVFTADFFGPVYDQNLWRHPLLKIRSKKCLQQL